MAAPRLVRIVAVLTSAPGLPHGDITRILDLLAPLTTDRQLDAPGFAAVAAYCRASLTQSGTVEWSGPLLHTDAGWMIRRHALEDAPHWPLTARSVRPGEYLALTPPGDGPWAFRIVNVAAP